MTAIAWHSEGRSTGAGRIRSQDANGAASKAASESGTHDSETVYYVKSLSRKIPGDEHRLSVVEISRDHADRITELQGQFRGENSPTTSAVFELYRLERELGIDAMPRINMVRHGNGEVETEGRRLLSSIVITSRDIEGWTRE